MMPTAARLMLRHHHAVGYGQRGEGRIVIVTVSPQADVGSLVIDDVAR